MSKNVSPILVSWLQGVDKIKIIFNFFPLQIKKDP